MLWRDPLTLSLMTFLRYHISFDVSVEGRNNNWHLFSMYGWSDRSERQKTWRLCTSWLCMRDFNQIMWSMEKQGGSPLAQPRCVSFGTPPPFSKLQDLGFRDHKFRWSNHRTGDENIQVRLDRALATPEWHIGFPFHFIYHRLRIKSDHTPWLSCLTSAPRMITKKIIRGGLGPSGSRKYGQNTANAGMLLKPDGMRKELQLSLCKKPSLVATS